MRKPQTQPAKSKQSGESAFGGMLVPTTQDRERAEALIQTFGRDAVFQAVRAISSANERPFPWAVRKFLNQQSAGGVQKPLAPPDKPAWLPFISDGLRLGVRFKYHPTCVQWFKTACTDCGVSQRPRFHPESKSWVLSRTKMVRVLDWLEDHGGVFPRDVAARYTEDAVEQPQPYFAKSLNIRLSRTRNSQTIILESEYDDDLVRALRETQAGKWKPAARAWVMDLSLSRIIEVLAGVMIPQDAVTITQDLLEYVSLGDAEAIGGVLNLGPTTPLEPGEDAIAKDGVLLAASKVMAAQEVSEDRIAQAAQEHALMPHQIDGVRHLLRYTSALLADDMGLGKTRQAIVSCIILGQPTLVLCPATLKANWKREILDRGVDADSVQVIGGSVKPDPTKFWWIANYELAPRLAGLPFSSMVVDEAHYLKEPTALRTQNAFRLAAKARQIMLLTATPILNRESELWTLLRLSGHELGSLGLADFQRLHAGSSEARQELGKRVSEWMLRRMKTDTVGIPGKTRSEPPIAVDEDAMSEYREIWKSDINQLEKTGKLRVWLERAKVPFILESLQGLQVADKAIIFCEFLDSVGMFMDDLGPAAVRLTGQESMRARKAAEDAFQNDPDIRFLVTTFKAGGVGLNLTAARYVFMASRPWTPAEMAQAEDRANRLGQTELVQVVVPIVEGTIDEQIIDLLNAKQEVTTDVFAGPSRDIHRIRDLEVHIR